MRTFGAHKPGFLFTETYFFFVLLNIAFSFREFLILIHRRLDTKKYRSEVKLKQGFVKTHSVKLFLSSNALYIDSLFRLAVFRYGTYTSTLKIAIWLILISPLVRIYIFIASIHIFPAIIASWWKYLPLYILYST